MYKLLIVEDERITREGLRDCVDWCQYNIEVTAEASNGQEALELLGKNTMDIVLTDVVMPLMDGIELVRQIRQRNMIVKVVFVSGYWDMPYLKAAFELDASDYILKPVKLIELDRVIKKVVSICSHELEQKKTILEMKSRLEASMPALREKFVTGLLTGSIEKEDIIEHRARFLELPFIMDGYFTVITAQLNNIKNGGIAENVKQQELHQLIIKDIIKSTINTQYKVFCLTMKDEHISIILNSCNSLSYNQIAIIAKKIQNEIQETIDVQVSVGVGEYVKSIGHLHISYQKSLRALEQKYFLGDGKIIHFQDIDYKNNNPDYYPHNLQEKIFNAIRLGREQEVQALVTQFFIEVHEYPGIRIEYIQAICLEIIVLTGKLVLEVCNIPLEVGLRKDLWRKVLQLETIKETEKWMCNQLCDMTKHIINEQSQRSKRIIGRIKIVIQERYSDNITIQSLSEEFYLTPNYISLLFKQETGENFKEYLTMVRMEKAKTLMKDISLKLYEIAEATGYADPDYFTKVFKKYIGATPTEFRGKLK